VFLPTEIKDFASVSAINNFLRLSIHVDAIHIYDFYCCAIRFEVTASLYTMQNDLGNNKTVFKRYE
jgi:hypothetical protein